MTPALRADEVIGRCRALGFAGVGVSAVADSSRGREFREWLGSAAHGSMRYLEEFVEQRLNPARMLEGARSIIMVADLYTPRDRAVDEPVSTGHGRIARYARGRDYHESIKRRLHRLSDDLRERFPGSEFRSFTDTAPVLEREHGARAGLGWVGKNTMLIHPSIGSYFVIGGVLTTLELETPPGQRPFPDHCGTCTRCIDACPTGAITPYRVDGSRCISYLTIEHQTEIAPEFFAPIGSWLYGCDICQEVCPHNSPRELTVAADQDDEPAPARRQGGWGVDVELPKYPAAAEISGESGRPPGASMPRNPDYTPRLSTLDAAEVLDWNEETRRATFTTSAMKRASLEMMKRNALIVAGNTIRENPDALESRALESRVRRAMEDPKEPELVRRTAREVLKRLGRE